MTEQSWQDLHKQFHCVHPKGCPFCSWCGYKRPPKASDIGDSLITAAIGIGVTSLPHLQAEMADFYPPKVVQAKLAQMVNKGRLLGCACGCRGDFAIPETPEAGRAARDARRARRGQMACSNSH
jgi:hypothetical protein